LWRCNGGFGPCTAQNHLRTKQFVSGTWNSSRVAACALQNEEAGRDHPPRLSSMCKKCLSGALRSQQISSTCKVGQKLGVSLPLLTCSPSAWPSWLLYRRGRKSRRGLWITLYINSIFSSNKFSFWITGPVTLLTWSYVNKLKYFSFIWWFLISVHTITIGQFNLVTNLLSLENLVWHHLQSALCI